ncbi:MAG: CHASE domain-containing protein [Anaerolineae bacterium]
MWEWDAQTGQRVTISPRDAYYSIIYIEPAEPLGELVGYDLGSDEAHRAAMMLAERAPRIDQGDSPDSEYE